MNRKAIYILLSALLAVSTLTGCGAKKVESKVCTDKKILSLLKNDGSPEFVLDWNHYVLPIQVSALTMQGWTYTLNQYADQEVILKPNERISATFKKDGHNLSAEIVNIGTEPCAPNDFCQIVELTISEYSEEANPDFFVTMNGIGLGTSADGMKEALKDMKGYQSESEYNYINTDIDGSEVETLRASVSNDMAIIQLSSANKFSYQAYVPQDVKDQESSDKVAEYKATAEKEIQPYANDYNALVAKVESNSTCGFYSQGTVIGKIEGYYKRLAGTAMQTDVSLYTVTDASGQVYCIYEGVIGTGDTLLDIPELAEGEQISLWGFAGNVLESEDGSKIPVVIPKIIEKDGANFYLDEEYQVK